MEVGFTNLHGSNILLYKKELMHHADLLNTLDVGLERSKVESRTQFRSPPRITHTDTANT